MTKTKLTYRQTMDGLNRAANINEMKAIRDKAGLGDKLTDNQLRSILRGRAAWDGVRFAMAKPVKIGKPLTDRELAKAYPTKGEPVRMWFYGDGDGYRDVPMVHFRSVLRRWLDGEELQGDDGRVFENRADTVSINNLYNANQSLYRRIVTPVRRTEDGFECGDYSLSLDDGKRVADLAMNYWAGLDDSRHIDELPNSEHDVDVYTDYVEIGCQTVDRADVTRMAVEAGFWKEPS